jgi:hypothetical protein
MRTLVKVKHEATRLLVDYQKHEGDRAKTPEILRSLAGVLVELREHFITDAGEPDWSGRSYGYRQAVREIYSDSGLPAEAVSRVQAAVRYHVGSVLRERVDGDAIESLGMSPDAPVVRSRASRARRSAQLQALRGGDPEGFVGIDALRAIEGARALLSRVSPADIKAAPAGERRAAGEILRAIGDRAAVLGKAAMTK